MHYNFLPSIAPERLITDIYEFERQLDLNVPLALPSKLRSGLFEFPFYWIEHHEMKIALVTFSFTRYQNGEVMVTISDFSLMDDFAEKKFYQTFADFHHVEEKAYLLSTPVKVGPIASDRVNIHRNIRSKLLLKHDLSFDEQDDILSAIKSVSKNARGYRAKISYKGDVFSVYLDIEKDGSIVVKSGYVDQRD